MLIALLLLASACRPAVEQPAPVPLPTQPAVPAGPAPDLAPYRAAMRPEFASDLDAFAGAPRYRIELAVAPDLTAVTGTETVHYTNLENVALDVVYFRVFSNAASYGGHTTLTRLAAGGAAVSPTLEIGGSAVRVPLAAPLAPGAAVDFELAWQTAVPTQTVTAGYNQFGLHAGVLALPNVYPLIPVYDEEGWNVEDPPGQGDAVYSDTALYDVTIRAPAGQKLAASGVCQAEGSGGTPVWTWHCLSGPMRDFVVILSADFQINSTVHDGININSYYLPRDAAGGQRAVQQAADAVATYEKHVGPYPFNELDVVETPTEAGGIEYPGLVVIASGTYSFARDEEGVIAHEVAHQWWYSLVGNDQLDEPWLDESLTQFTTVFYYEDVYNQKPLSAALLDDLFGRRYGRVKNKPEDLRADLPVASYTGLQYGSIVYGKAALFFVELRKAMGPDAFDRFLQEYFTTYRYRIAHGPDLLAGAARFVDQATLDRLLRQWITTPDP